MEQNSNVNPSEHYAIGRERTYGPRDHTFHVSNCSLERNRPLILRQNGQRHEGRLDFDRDDDASKVRRISYAECESISPDQLNVEGLLTS